MAANYNWESLCDNDVDIYSSNIISAITDISKICIPNRQVLIRDHEPPWFDNNIRLYIRRRKRAYRKARGSNSEQRWNKFRTLRNETTNLIKSAKHKYNVSLADKLKTQNNSSKSWWSCLKSFIRYTSSQAVPPLKSGTNVIDDTKSKADLLNNYFRIIRTRFN